MAIHELDGVGPELPAAGEFWVAPSATIIGKVTLGKGVGVWFGTVMRGDNERITIGADTNVQELCMFHTDMGFPLTIGAGCTIGHRAIVHGCIIGNNTLVGMGATVMNGVDDRRQLPDRGRRARSRRGAAFRPVRWSWACRASRCASSAPRRSRPTAIPPSTTSPTGSATPRASGRRCRTCTRSVVSVVVAVEPGLRVDVVAGPVAVAPGQVPGGIVRQLLRHRVVARRAERAAALEA